MVRLEPIMLRPWHASVAEDRSVVPPSRLGGDYAWFGTGVRALAKSEEFPPPPEMLASRGARRAGGQRLASASLARSWSAVTWRPLPGGGGQPVPGVLYGAPYAGV